MRLAIATLTVLALATVPAAARCISVPDNAASSYVNNGVARTICLQDELAGTTNQINNQARLDAELANIQQQLRQLQQQRINDNLSRSLTDF